MSVPKQTRVRLDAVGDKVLDGERISAEEAVLLLEHEDLTTLGAMGDLVRRRKHTDGVVTYIVDRNINYTNVCNAFCNFCAFYRPPNHDEGYVLPVEEIEAKIRETYDLGGNQILLQGGHHPKLKIEYYEELETLRRLREAGLDSIPGGGAEILVDRVRRKLAKNKCSSQEWLDVMEEAHRQGLRSTATMMFGHVETLSERVEHLERVRDLQDRTAGFTAFIGWTFQPDNTELGGREATTAEYLRMLSVSRVFLDNIENFQASWVTQGPKIGGASLAFGANDMGSTMLEENVVSAAGTVHQMLEPQIVAAIRDAGFIPMRRNMHYERM